MTWVEILARLEAGEDERTEFKRGLGDLKALGKAIAAFANSVGGVLVLGVDDDGTIVGLKEDANKLVERLTSFLQFGLSTPVQASLAQQQDPNGRVHWIEVPRQRGFEPLRFDGRVFVRRGRASVEPSPAELQDLYNMFGYILTEERAIEAADISAIDVGTFKDYLERLGLDLQTEPQLELENDLRARGVLTEIGGAHRATLYGLMAFGRQPQATPQTQNFWVECVAYAGTDRADEVLQVAEAKGRLDEQVERSMGWVLGLAHREEYRGIVRKDQALLPRRAVREVLVNAAGHRDYAITGSKILLEVFSDRLELTSPGRLPNGLTIESVTRGGNPRSRNESIANFLLVRGLMEQRGRGWPVVRRAMKEHNGSSPLLEEDRQARFVRVTLWLSPPEKTTAESEQDFATDSLDEATRGS